MALANASDFNIDVPGIGKFRFNRKTYGAVIQIRAERLRVLRGGGEDDPEMRGHATVVSHYKVLMVECPEGWEDLETIDLAVSPEKEDHILRVWFALEEKLNSFRQPTTADQASEGSSKAAL